MKKFKLLCQKNSAGKKKDPNPRKFSTGLQWHACSRLLHFCYLQGTGFAENLVTLVEKKV